MILIRGIMKTTTSRFLRRKNLNLIFYSLLLMISFFFFQNFTVVGNVVTVYPNELHLKNGRSIRLSKNPDLILQMRDGQVDLNYYYYTSGGLGYFKTIWSYYNSQASSFDFEADGNLAIRDSSGNILFDTKTTLAANPKLQFSSEPPFFQVLDDMGIAWTTGQGLKNFNLNTAQRINVGSSLDMKVVGSLVMQPNGYLNYYVNNNIVWSSNTPNTRRVWKWRGFNSSYKTEFLGMFHATLDELGNFNVLNQNNSAQWGVNLNSQNTRLYLNSTEPFLYLKGLPSTSTDVEEIVKWAPRPNLLKCASYTTGSISCLHPLMPLYSQSSNDNWGFRNPGASLGLLEYINKADQTNLPSDPGWCSPTSSSMVGKAVALEKGYYFSETSGIPTSTFLDYKDSNYVIWNMKNLEKTTTTGTFVEEIYNAMISLKLNVLVSGKVVLTGPGAGYADPIQNPFQAYNYGKMLFSGTGSPGGIVLGGVATNQPNTFVPTPEEMIFQHMPMGLISTCKHTFAVNGREGNYLKVFDPWGSIYDVDTTNYKFKFAKMLDNRIGGSELNSECGGVSPLTYPIAISSQVPIQPKPIQ